MIRSTAFVALTVLMIFTLSSESLPANASEGNGSAGGEEVEMQQIARCVSEGGTFHDSLTVDVHQKPNGQFFADFPGQVEITRTRCVEGGVDAQPLRMESFGVSKNDLQQWVVTATALGQSVRWLVDETSRYEITTTSYGKRIDLHGRGPAWALSLESGVPTLIITYVAPRFSGPDWSKECFWSGNRQE